MPNPQLPTPMSSQYKKTRRGKTLQDNTYQYQENLMTTGPSREQNPEPPVFTGKGYKGYSIQIKEKGDI